MIAPLSAFSGSVYRHVVKPVFFRMDPERVHDRTVRLGRTLGALAPVRAVMRTLWRYDDPILTSTVAGITFPNTVGLAAGFDKNAQLASVLPDVGFGFAELGSFTGRPCPGNPGTRLWRLPKSESLVVYYGLKNDGADAISARLRGVSFRFPVGISAAKTNSRDVTGVQEGIDDYVHVIERFRGIGDYITVNISCPNVYGGEPFTEPDRLDRLLSAVDGVADKPVFVKFAVDLSATHLDELIAVARTHRVTGFVCSNLTKDRSNHRIIETEVPDKGGISGRAVRDLSDGQIRHVYRATGGTMPIIGVGGIFGAEDAYRKIRAGASLVQLITGMIYRGPQLIGEINHGLARLLRRDGFSNVHDAVGVDNQA